MTKPALDRLELALLCLVWLICLLIVRHPEWLTWIGERLR